MALLSQITGLDMAYMAVQLAAILLLALGAYRFSLLWVNPRAASFAALASVFLGSESFLVYSAGQLSTTSAAPIYLNALPYLFEWVRHGRWRSFLKGECALYRRGRCSPCHAALRVLLLCAARPGTGVCWTVRTASERSIGAFVIRTVAITLVVGAAIAIVLLPFWIALIHYPVTQTPIPHPSRANYILSPQWGLNYFIVPYGALILALPFILIRGSAVVRLRPLLLGFWLAFLVGLGGTTPVGHLLLGRAFEVLTMERFSYWATLLALPFVGLLAAELIDRFPHACSCRFNAGRSSHLRTGGCLDHLSAGRCLEYQNGLLSPRGLIATVTTSTAMSPWDSATKIARLAMMTDAGSVDGEWNSGRMLPELTRYGAGRAHQFKILRRAGP